MLYLVGAETIGLYELLEALEGFMKAVNPNGFKHNWNMAMLTKKKRVRKKYINKLLGK